MDYFRSLWSYLRYNFPYFWSSRSMSGSLDLMCLYPRGEENPLMIQFFTWDCKHPEMSWWKHFEHEIPRLEELGATQVWLPPPNKAMRKTGQGYDAYDLWDLGEFDQKGSIPTRWGSKQDLLEACAVAKSHGVHVLIDAVLGHKLGADRTEKFIATPVKADNRLVNKAPPREVEGWTIYEFPGRGDKHSSLKWNHAHFTGIDWDHATRTSDIYYIEAPGRQGWSKYVDSELGNYDYLLGCDIDHTHPDVREDLLNWGSWVIETTGATGFRLDAIKHFDRRFTLDFLRTTRQSPNRHDLFAVAEYWSGDIYRIEPYLWAFEGKLAFFDVPLHYNFHQASKNADFDLRKIFHNTVIARYPRDAVTFVDNHDTQIGQTLESWVDSRFKLQAYALTLLRSDGYPCVFYGDLYPNDECYDAEIAPKLETLIKARKLYAYGTTIDYFQYRNCIGFVRSGQDGRPGCVVVVALPKKDPDAGDSKPTQIKMRVENKTAIYRDLFGFDRDVTVSESGWGLFPCSHLGVSVWIVKDVDN